MQETWVRKTPWRKKWQPTLVFLPGKSHGKRSLAGYSPWGRKESYTTQRLNNNSCKQERQLHHKVDLGWPTVLVLAFKVLCCRNFSVQAKQGGWSPLVEHILIGIFFLSCFIVLKMWNCESLENIQQMDYKAYLFSLSFSSLKQNMEIKKQTVHSSTRMSQVWVFMVINSICTAFTI